MDWTKIKPKHFLFTDFTLSEHGALARILCLAAHLERTPSEQEMVNVTHYKTLKALQQRLNSHSITLQQAVNKVLEDAQGIEYKRKISRETTRRYREKIELSDTSLDTTEKRREEKRREELYKERFEITWKNYPKKAGKPKAEEYFKKSVITDQDYQDIQNALKNYLELLKIDTWRQPKDGQGWFNPQIWKGFIDYEQYQTPEEKRAALMKTIIGDDYEA